MLQPPPARPAPAVKPPLASTKHAPAVTPVAPLDMPASRTAPVPTNAVPQVAPPSTTRDSSGAASRSAATPPTGATGRGAPMAPSGVTIGSRSATTPAIRDSIARAKMNDVPGMMTTHPPTGAERLELEGSQRLAAALRERSLTSGNSRDLVTLQGKGKDGVGAVGGPGMVSIGVPLFSSGPSAEQRKKNEKLDAEYQLRLRRLEDRMLLKRDSLLADSLRVDSLRRDLLAKRRAPRP
jgi:hypothetical protein